MRFILGSFVIGGLVLSFITGCFENEPEIQDFENLTPKTVTVTGPNAEPVEICNDMIDNTGNGLIDCDDSECESHEDCVVPPTCGNGILDAGEACDKALEPTLCIADCSACLTGFVPDPTRQGFCKLDDSVVPPTCGNGILDAGEACDKALEPTLCIADCSACLTGFVPDPTREGFCKLDDTVVPPTCGNGILDAGEACDKALEPTLCIADCSACLTGFVPDPTREGFCKLDDSIVPPVEICDNGLDDSGNGLIDAGDPACRDEQVASLTISTLNLQTNERYVVDSMYVICPNMVSPLIINGTSFQIHESLTIWIDGKDASFGGKDGCKIWLKSNGFLLQTKQVAGVWLPDNSGNWPSSPNSNSPDHVVFGYGTPAGATFQWTSSPTGPMKSVNIMLFAIPFLNGEWWTP